MGSGSFRSVSPLRRRSQPPSALPQVHRFRACCSDRAANRARRWPLVESKSPVPTAAGQCISCPDFPCRWPCHRAPGAGGPAYLTLSVEPRNFPSPRPPRARGRRTLRWVADTITRAGESEGGVEAKWNVGVGGAMKPAMGRGAGPPDPDSSTRGRVVGRGVPLATQPSTRRCPTAPHHLHPVSTTLKPVPLPTRRVHSSSVAGAITPLLVPSDYRRYLTIIMAPVLRPTTLVAGLLLAAVSAVVTCAAGEYMTDSSSRSDPLKVALPLKTKPGRQGRIVGGRRVDRFDPSTGVQFIAKLFTRTKNGYGFYCGGTVVSDHPHVLTRAGCHPQVGDLVLLGGARLFTGLRAKVQAVAIHPSYDERGDLADLAVLTLHQIPTWKLRREEILPAQLNQRWDNPHGLYLTGFGATDKAARSAGSLQLKRGYQPVASWPTCYKITDLVQVPGLPHHGLPINEDAQVCLQGSNRSGALCERDVGGPMFRVENRLIREKGRLVEARVYVLYAISSYWIATETERCPQGKPNVGTKVAFYYKWIHSHMK